MKKLLLTTTMVVSMAASAAIAGQKAQVADYKGSSIGTIYGDCVKTRWIGGKSGCATADNNVYFASGSAALSAKSRKTLNAIAGNLASQHSRLKEIQITGYTDETGSPEANKKLAQRRAEAVKSYLISKKRNVSHLIKVDVDSAGESFAKDCGGSASCLRKDRRVEIILDF